ncbi:MAG TPA: hypothetical protein DEA08_15005 [Planctomycetes bacterium]|nr:hypothetical protein [Planctomycetota bacterium]|tara:strand:- start:734 stop:1456 length:723 start_codon:yes stop_codon:yes gene_type:complete
MSDSQQSSDQQQSSEPKAREVEHEVQPDEDLAIIALDYGIKDWKLIWEHEKNADLRAKRPDPHVLYKGDKVWIPEVQPAEHEVELKQEHTFVIYPPRYPIHLEFEENEESKGAIKYELEVDDERYHPSGKEEELRTSNDRKLEVQVPIGRKILVRAWDHGDDQEPSLLEIHPGHLDPADTPEGAHDRLEELGYDCGEDDPATLGEHTKEALKEFQLEHGLEGSGELDQATQQKLVEVYGA